MKPLGLFAGLLLPGVAQAFCGTYIGGPGDELYNDASQIVIARQGDSTTLTLVNDYSGDLSEFAMVIPVPEVLEEEDVRTVDGDFIATIQRFSEPRLVSYSCDDFDYGPVNVSLGCTDEYVLYSLADDPQSEESTVLVESEFTVGIYEIVVLSAEESGDLMQWLNSNGYGVDASAEDLLGEYIDSGAFFFAAKVNLGDQLAGGGNAPTWLEPLQFTYQSEGFSLPIRLGTLNSRGSQDLLMYTLTSYDKGTVGISNYPEIEIPRDCMLGPDGSITEHIEDAFDKGLADQGGSGWTVEHSWTPYHCDPCTGPTLGNDVILEMGFDLTEGEVPWFSRVHVRYTADVTQDLMMYTTGNTDSRQARFIEFNPSVAQRFDFCDPETTYDKRQADAICPPAYKKGQMQWSSLGGIPMGSLAIFSVLGLGFIRRRRSQ